MLLPHKAPVIVDAIRAAAAGGAIFLAGLFSTQPPTETAPHVTPPGSEQILDIAIRQGGLLLVLIVVLFFYRRDYVKLTDFWQEQQKHQEQQTTIIVELVKGTTKALTDDAAATREMSIVMHQAKNVMQQILPHRRDEDGPAGPRRPQ